MRRLALSRLISTAGTDASGVAIGFVLYAQTQSPMWLSLSLMLTVGTSALLSPVGGRIGDLVDRRRLMIALELLSAVVFVVLALVHSPAALLALSVLASTLGAVFGPASGAAIAHVAGERHLGAANAIIATGQNVGRTAGRLGAGALMAALGASAVFVLDALTFLVSAWLIRSVRRAFSAPLTGPAPGEAPAPVARRQGGLRVLLGDRRLRPVVAAACVSTFATAFSMTAEVPLVFEIGAGALGLGALTACWGAGMVAGSWYAGRVLRADTEAAGVLAGRLLMAAGVGAVALAPSLSPMLLCYLLGGAGGGFMGVAAQSLVTRATPDHLRASVLGAMEGCRNAAFGLGIAGAGAAVGLAGARPVYALVGIVMALGTLPLAASVVGATRIKGSDPYAVA